MHHLYVTYDFHMKPTPTEVPVTCFLGRFQHTHGSHPDHPGTPCSIAPLPTRHS